MRATDASLLSALPSIPSSGRGQTWPDARNLASLPRRELPAGLERHEKRHSDSLFQNGKFGNLRSRPRRRHSEAGYPPLCLRTPGRDSKSLWGDWDGMKRGETKEWWPETGLNRRRRPFQGLNNLYLQLLTSLRGPPKYGEIRVKRANHG